MKLDWKYIANSSLRIVSKGVLIVGSVYLLVLLFLSLFYQPQQVRVTNVTSSSATVSWYTEAPMTGVVVYKEKDSFLPWVLSSVGGRKAYDDRDYARAQRECVEDFNKEIESEVDEDFAVSGENYNCDTVTVKRIGRYYVHHVTIRNLDESKEYHFRVGDRLWGWKGEVSSLKTFKTPTTIKEPTPVFGRIVSSDGNYSSDSIVFAKFLNTKAQVSVEYSSVTNEEGGWYLDGGNLMSNAGEAMDVASGNDLFEVTGRYKSSAETLPIKWVFGDFDGAYPDLEIEYKEKDNFLYKLVFGVNAACNAGNAGTTACSGAALEAYAANIGYGNAAKQVANNTNQPLNGNVLNQIGLENNAGNYSAIVGGSNAVTQTNYGNNNYTPVEVKEDADGNLIGWEKPPVSDSSGGTPGSSAQPEGSINLSVGVTGSWSLTFGGVELNGEENIRKFLNLDKPMDDHIKQHCQSRDVNSPATCSFTIQPMQINIVNLIQSNPKFETCISDGSCNVKGLDEAIEKQQQDLAKLYGNNTASIALLDKLRSDLQQSVKLKIENGALLDAPIVYTLYQPGEIVSGPKLNQWLTLFDKYATDEERRLLAIQMGIPEKDLNNINWDKVHFYVQGITGTVTLKDENEDILFKSETDLGLYSNSIDLFISQETYKQIEGSAPISGKYKSNENQGNVLVSSDFIDSSSITKLNKELSNEEKVEFARSLGIDIHSNVNTGVDVELSFVDGKVVVNYRRTGDSKIIEKTASDLPSTIVLDATSYLELFPDAEAADPIVVNQSQVGLNTPLQNVDPTDFIKEGEIGVVLQNEICLDQEQTTCTRSNALELAKYLNSNKATAGSEGIYVVYETGTQSSPYYSVKYIPTEQELAEIQKNLEVEMKKLEELQGVVGGTGSFLRKLILRTTFAAEKKVDNGTGSVFFLPEYGMFSLSLGDFEFERDVSDGTTFYIFYLETNGKEGFQAPADPDNPTIYEDMMIRSRSFEIQYEKKAEVRKYDLNKGVNIVSFDFIPVGISGASYRASDLIANAQRNGTRIEYVSYFDGGRWIEGYKCTNDTCVGSNFTLLPGKGYLLKTANKGFVSVSAYNLKSAIPLNLSAGWNLIGIHGYKQVYTAKSFIQSVNKVEGLNADNVSWYPTSKGRYEGFQLTDGAEYGFDFPINPMNGYFIRINEFTPGDESCKSVIWHEGNDLNGVCGDSKSIF